MQLQKIIQKCAKGDRRAQKRFFDLYSDRLFAIAKRYATSDELAEEALFQAFLKIFDSLKNFSFINEPALIAWLTKIVINQTLMDRRKELNILYKTESINEEHSSKISTEDFSDDELIEIVNQLPEGYKTVFLMYVVDGYSHKEIAVTLEISESTSRTQFFKARKLLQKKLNYDYGQAGT